MMKVLLKIFLSLTIFSFINLCGNIVRLFPGLQIYFDWIFYGIIFMAIALIIIQHIRFQYQQITADNVVVVWVLCIGVSFLYASAFKLAWLDVAIKSHVESISQ